MIMTIPSINNNLLTLSILHKSNNSENSWPPKSEKPRKKWKMANHSSQLTQITWISKCWTKNSERGLDLKRLLVFQLLRIIKKLIVDKTTQVILWSLLRQTSMDVDHPLLWIIREEVCPSRWPQLIRMMQAGWRCPAQTMKNPRWWASCHFLSSCSTGGFNRACYRTVVGCFSCLVHKQIQVLSDSSSRQCLHK